MREKDSRSIWTDKTSLVQQPELWAVESEILFVFNSILKSIKLISLFPLLFRTVCVLLQYTFCRIIHIVESHRNGFQIKLDSQFVLVAFLRRHYRNSKTLKCTVCFIIEVSCLKLRLSNFYKNNFYFDLCEG